MKKFISLIIVLTMIFTICMTSFALTDGNYTKDVSFVVKGLVFYPAGTIIDNRIGIGKWIPTFFQPPGTIYKTPVDVYGFKLYYMFSGTEMKVTAYCDRAYYVRWYKSNTVPCRIAYKVTKGKINSVRFMYMR